MLVSRVVGFSHPVNALFTSEIRSLGETTGLRQLFGLTDGVARQVARGHNAAMCYSAQIQAAYMKYLRETGAEMDVDQFVEIFSHRVVDSSIRIPRAVERWFDDPKTDGERQIKTFIDQYREAETNKLEREVFLQRRRLADAERTLASKATKAATESKRIAGNKIEQAMTRLERLKATKPHVAEARIFPMHYAPIVLQDGERRVMRLARYHCRKPGEREGVDRQLPGLYNAFGAFLTLM